VSTGFGAEAGLSGRAQQGLRVLDEAVRLLDVVQAEHGRRGSASGSDGADSASGPDGADSASHRGGECRVCPVCRGLAALREANPEAMARMTRAVADLAAAIGDVVAGPERAQPRDPAPEAETGNRWYATDERQGGPLGTRRTMVQRIDVTE
jgi:hypothetical protein